MDNFCSYHQANRLEKTCPQWINATTLVINRLLDQQSVEDQSEELVEEESPLTDDESSAGSSMLLLDIVVDRDTLSIGEASVGETQPAKATKPYNL